MANFVPISLNQANQFLDEAIGALALHLAEGEPIYAVQDFCCTKPALWDLQDRMENCARNATFAALGTFVFVYPYERYKKVLVRYPTLGIDPSEAFGLNQYSSRSSFESSFPSSIIHEWKYDATRDRPAWFADCVRNSFAHAQTTLKADYKRSGSLVEMWNTKDGRTVDFHIEMRRGDFMRLMKTALMRFVGNVVQRDDGSPVVLEGQLLDPSKPVRGPSACGHLMYPLEHLAVLPALWDESYEQEKT